MKKGIIPVIIINLVIIVLTVLSFLNSRFEVLIYGYETGLVLLSISILITAWYALKRVIFESKWQGTTGTNFSTFIKQVIIFIFKVVASYGIGLLILTYLFQTDYIYAVYMVPIGLGIVNIIDNIHLYSVTIDF